MSRNPYAAPLYDYGSMRRSRWSSFLDHAIAMVLVFSYFTMAVGGMATGIVIVVNVIGWMTQLGQQWGLDTWVHDLRH